LNGWDIFVLLASTNEPSTSQTLVSSQVPSTKPTTTRALRAFDFKTQSTQETFTTQPEDGSKVLRTKKPTAQFISTETGKANYGSSTGGKFFFGHFQGTKVA